jgi:hypothetical protein
MSKMKRISPTSGNKSTIKNDMLSSFTIRRKYIKEKNPSAGSLLGQFPRFFKDFKGELVSIFIHLTQLNSQSIYVF